MTWLWLWLACTSDADPAWPDEAVDSGSEPGAPVGVLATLSLDYTSGTLSTVDVATRDVRNDIATVHPDTVVQTTTGAVWVIQRLLADTLRRYDPRDLGVPVWERSVGPGSNPHAIALADDLVIISRYGEATLLLLDAATGVDRGTIDLSAWADDDGIPEASDLVVLDDGTVWVGLQRLRRLQGWDPSATGRAVRVDVTPPSAAVGWEAPPNVVLRGTADQLVALGATGIAWIDPHTGTTTHESTDGLGLGDLVDADVDADGSMVAILRDGEIHTPACRDAAGGWTTGEPLNKYVPDVARGPDGAVWLALRPPWSDPLAGGGLLRLDPGTCLPLADSPEIATSFPPFSMAFTEAAR